MLRVLHLTDPHLFADPEGALRGKATLASLSDVLAHYAAGAWRADLVVVTGDLIQDDSAMAYEHFRRLLGGLELPVYCLPGNHDVPNLMREAVGKPPFFYCGSVERGNWAVVCLDSCVIGEAGGRVTASELARLDKILQVSRMEHAMVCLHHPPVTMGSRWLDTVGLDNGDELLQRLSGSERVRLTIFGHVHQDYDANHHGIRIIATPSTCRQFTPRSDDFAVDDNPPAYRRFELWPDGGVDQELVWVSQT